MSLRSMTGYARVRRSGELGEAVATVRSVNHRALDLHMHLPAEVEQFEPALRNVARAAISRGHVDVRLSFTPAHPAATAGLNRPLFEAYLKAVEEARTGYGIATQPELAVAFAIPGMLSQPAESGDSQPELEGFLVETVKEAMRALAVFREREGAGIASLIREHNAALRRDAAEIQKFREPAREVFRARLDERLKELLQGAALDPQRLAMEAAVLADRSDIAEELGRLSVHSAELDQILDKGGEIGKKLDFLMQEMSRETNTVLSKTAGSGEAGLKISALALEIKSNIERIREQALNIE